jgi:hypothetical protein
MLAILLLIKRKFLRSFTRSFEAIARRISESSTDSTGSADTYLFEFFEELEERRGKCGVLILSMDSKSRIWNPEDRFLDLKIRK